MTADVAELVSSNLDVWTAAVERKSRVGRGGGKRINLYGVDRLRSLILDLAMRGKLVPQNPQDEPAAELLKRVAQARNKLAANGQVRVQKSAPPDVPVLPAGWEVVRLNELCNSQAGFAFKSDGFNEKGIGLPLIRIRDVGQPFTGTFYSGEYREEFVVEPGDYLISMDGEFRVATWQGERALLNQRVSRLQFYSTEIEARFVAIELQTELSKLQGVKAYTTVDHLSGKQIAETRISLPPPAEQKRIVAKVDDLMALCDTLESNSAAAMSAHQALVAALLATLVDCADASDLSTQWSRLQSHFDTLFTTEASVNALRQTILDLAVRGKLVPREPADESASELLKRIAHERQQIVARRKIRGANPPPPPSPEGESFVLPEGWQLCSLGQVTLVTDPNPSHRYPDYKGGTVPILSTREFSGETGWNPVTAKLTTESVWQSQNEICDFQDGDIVFARKGRLGLPRFLPGLDRFTFSHTLFILKPMTGLDPSYLLWLLRREEVVFWLTNKMNQNTGVPTLGKAQTERLPVPLPPSAEQRRIVAKIEELVALCDALKSRVAEATETRIRLADAIVELAAA